MGTAPCASPNSESKKKRRPYMAIGRHCLGGWGPKSPTSENLPRPATSSMLALLASRAANNVARAGKASLDACVRCNKCDCTSKYRRGQSGLGEGWRQLILYHAVHCSHTFCVRSRTSTRLCAIKLCIVAECGLHGEFISNAGGDKLTL